MHKFSNYWSRIAGFTPLSIRDLLFVPALMGFLNTPVFQVTNESELDRRSIDPTVGTGPKQAS